MEREALDKANIDNLTHLWRSMGAHDHVTGAGHVLHASNDWPHRLWLDWGVAPDTAALAGLLSGFGDALDAYVFAVWGEGEVSVREVLHEQGLRLAFKQSAMVLRLSNEACAGVPDQGIRRVANPGDAATWACLASEAFGYSVPPGIVSAIMHAPGLGVYLAYAGDVPVGTGLLFDSDGVSGIHMVGVSPAYRRRGIAIRLMHALIALARAAGSRYVTLQASALGEPLYLNLGFERRFEVCNFTRA